MKPQTYMNLSGEAVREAAQFYKIPADHVLVIYDDVSLPVGKIRVRPSGSAGGHNGIKNIIAHWAPTEFPRVKIGTGAPPTAEQRYDRLGHRRAVSGGQEDLLDAFGRAIDAAECIVRETTAIARRP
jgi:PTH1 family peptidyl-tRNA hydrolase